MIISLQDVFDWLLAYRYLVLFPINIFEGPIVTVIAGFLAAQGFLNVYIVYVLAVLGDLTGDMLYYALGRWGRKSLLEKWGQYFGLNKKRINRIEKHFTKHPGKMLLFGKITHGIGSPILIASGIAKMPIKEYLWYNLLGTLPKSLFLLLIGYYFGQAYKRIGQYLDYVAWTTISIAVALILIYWIIVKIIKMKNNSK